MGINTGGNMNCPKKHIKDDFACDGILSDSENKENGAFQIFRTEKNGAFE